MSGRHNRGVRVTRSGASRFGFGRRLVGWIAAYAFVLHAVLAGAVATQLAATAGFELCVAGPAGPDGTPVGHGQSQHESCAIRSAARARAARAAVSAACRLARTRLRLPSGRRFPASCRPQPRASAACLILVRDRGASRRLQACMETTMTRRVPLFTGASALLFAFQAYAHHPGGASNAACLVRSITSD